MKLEKIQDYFVVISDEGKILDIKKEEDFPKLAPIQPFYPNYPYYPNYPWWGITTPYVYTPQTGTWTLTDVTPPTPTDPNTTTTPNYIIRGSITDTVDHDVSSGISYQLDKVDVNTYTTFTNTSDITFSNGSVVSIPN